VASEGLRMAHQSATAILVNADNNSADGTSSAFIAEAGKARRLLLRTGASGTGKGTNIMAIFHAALDAGAERVVVLDGDVTSSEPWWTARLLEAVRGSEPAMAVPVYRRNRYEGNTTNHLASPLLGAVLGVQVQQPIAGDFAFNRAFIERAVTWPLPESAQKYGIDIYLTGNAAREGYRITQVALGRKIHNPGFPKILTMSQQVIDSLWHVIVMGGYPRRATAPPGSVRTTVDITACRPDASLVERTFAKVSRYVVRHQDAITQLYPCMDMDLGAGGLPPIRAALWAEVLADALTAVAYGRAAEARDHLVALYLCRVRTYWQEIETLGHADAIDAPLDDQASAVAAAVGKRDLRFDVRHSMDFHPGLWLEEPS
jgi:glucosylglycerate synthase